MNNKLTEIVFLLDRSGSMTGLEEDTIGGFNSFIKKQKKLEGEVLVTTVLFDDKYELLHDGLDINDIYLSKDDYYTRGSTALLDAIGKTIIAVKHRIVNSKKHKEADKVIFVITTDGLENSSREFSYDNIKNLIAHEEKLNNWEFLFMAANIDVVKESANLGIKSENAHAFQASEDGIKYLYEELSNMIEKKIHK